MCKKKPGVYRCMNSTIKVLTTCNFYKQANKAYTLPKAGGLVGKGGACSSWRCKYEATVVGLVGVVVESGVVRLFLSNLISIAAIPTMKLVSNPSPFTCEGSPIEKNIDYHNFKISSSQTPWTFFFIVIPRWHIAQNKEIHNAKLANLGPQASHCLLPSFNFAPTKAPPS